MAASVDTQRPGDAGIARRIDLAGGRRSATIDRAFRGGTAAVAAFVVLLLVLIALVLVNDSRAAIAQFGVGFITGQVWDPQRATFGVLPYIYGTLFSSLLALFFSVPLAVGAALFIDEYAPSWLRAPVSFVVELLGAIPSIIYGLWGFFVLGPFMRGTIELWLKSGFGNVPVLKELVRGNPIGKDVLIAATILAIMILPTVMSVSREIIGSVPDTQREGMLALGATKWETIQGAVLPYARSGIIGAAILGLGRALGETMAVTLVIGNSSTRISWSLFTPGYTMASAIANQFNEADSPLYFSAIMGVAVTLLVIAGLTNLVARFIVQRVTGGPGGDTRVTAL